MIACVCYWKINIQSQISPFGIIGDLKLNHIWPVGVLRSMAWNYSEMILSYFFNHSSLTSELSIKLEICDGQFLLWSGTRKKNQR